MNAIDSDAARSGAGWVDWPRGLRTWNGVAKPAPVHLTKDHVPSASPVAAPKGDDAVTFDRCAKRQSQARPVKRRGWKIQVAFIALGLTCMPALAQLDQILRDLGGKNANELRRAAREAQVAARRGARDAERTRREQACQDVAAWFARNDSIPRDVMARRFGGSAQTAASEAAQVPFESWLLEDSRFIPMFGKAFDAMSPAEGAEIQELRTCPVPRNASGQMLVDNMFFYRAFHPSYQARYIQGVKTIRAAREQADSRTKELMTLGADDEGLRRLTELRTEAARLVPFLANDRREAYQQALAEANQRVALPVQGEKVRQAVLQARGYEGLQTLVQLHAEIPNITGRGGAPNPASADLRAKMSELALELVAVERVRLDALGSGLVNLERGVQWHREYMTRYSSLSGTATELREMLRVFEERRGVQLDAAQADFSVRVRQARSDADLQQLVARYLPLESDRRARAGTAMLTQVEQWRDELYKRSVLGTQAAAPAVTASPAAAPTAAASRPDPQVAARNARSASSGGEPGASEMYDLLKARFDAVAANAREMSESCKGRFDPNDPAKAMLCLAGGIAGMSGAQEPLKITKFEKLGCERAVGKPGYVCDYLIATSGAIHNAMGPSMAAILGRGGTGQGRFLRTNDGWIAFFDEK